MRNAGGGSSRWTRISNLLIDYNINQLAGRLEWNRSRDGCGEVHTGNSDHSKTSILDLTRAALGKCLSALALGKSHGVIKSRNHVLSRNSSTEVVGASARMEKLVVELDESSEEKHLGLTPSRDGIPCLKSLGGERSEFNSTGKLTREVDTGANGPPTDEGGHSNTSVLHLSMTEPGDGLVTSSSSKTKGIPDLSDLKAIRLSKDGFARQASGNGGGRGSYLDRGLNRLVAHAKNNILVQKAGAGGEGGSRSEKEGGDGKFHCRFRISC